MSARAAALTSSRRVAGAGCALVGAGLLHAPGAPGRILSEKRLERFVAERRDQGD